MKTENLVRGSDFSGKRILYADYLDQYVDAAGDVASVVMALHLEDGTILQFDAVEDRRLPVVTMSVERPTRKLPRLCHGCGQKLDRYLPVHVVFCGECGAVPDQP